MRGYQVTLNGKVPAIQHHDNIEWADEMEAWRAEPANQKLSKPGDDRTPAFRWLGSVYHDGRVIGWPNDNLMRCFMEGGALVPVPGGKNGKTFKAQTQSGMLVEGTHWPLLVNGKPIPIEPILKLKDEKVFAKQKAAVERLGFELFVKRVRIGGRKHVRVRPRFERWTASGIVHVWDDQITTAILTKIIEQAGLYKGLGDWRPGGRTPGSFGMFTVAVKPA